MSSSSVIYQLVLSILLQLMMGSVLSAEPSVDNVAAGLLRSGCLQEVTQGRR